APGGRSGGAGPGEPPADVQTRVFAGGRPGRPDNLAPPLGQERQDRVWGHVGRAAQQPGLAARLTAARPQRDDLNKQLHDTISAAFIAITLMTALPLGHAYQSRFLAVAADNAGRPTGKAPLPGAPADSLHGQRTVSEGEPGGERAKIRRYTGDRRSPKPFARITADTRVIITRSQRR